MRLVTVFESHVQIHLSVVNHPLLSSSLNIIYHLTVCLVFDAKMRFFDIFLLFSHPPGWIDFAPRLLGLAVNLVMYTMLAMRPPRESCQSVPQKVRRMNSE